MKDLQKKVSYLASLGIGSVYASPIFQAVSGSQHGYDITNPSAMNAEIGTVEEFSVLIDSLKSMHIGWIQDIVPNHMAFHSDNKWMMDVLKKGQKSEFAEFFDIDWEHPAFSGKVMVPVLDKTPESAISANEIRLVFKSRDYFIINKEFSFPVNDESIKELAERLPKSICEKVNADKSLLINLLDKQHYKLTFWQEAEERLNYRRFFTINGLICLNIDHDRTFKTYHDLVFGMIKEERITGLRIDHIDGLAYPQDYLEKLRAVAGEEVYIVIEKILGTQEELNRNWPVQGTTGYDFLAVSNNIFTRKESLITMCNFYCDKIHPGISLADFIYRKKKQALHQHFKADMDNLFRMIMEPDFFKFSKREDYERLKEAMEEFLLCFPLYRLYSDQFPLFPENVLLLKKIFSEASDRNPHLVSYLKILESTLTGNIVDSAKIKIAALFRRMMQYTGPLMAKGVEDSAMYAWNSFVAHNEVGDSLDSSGITIEDFHRIMKQRRKINPASMNATATHDTKRGEDTRARLNVISDLPDEWFRFVRQSMKMNHQFKARTAEGVIPDVNEEYFIYQTLLGMLPMEGAYDNEFTGRFTGYLQKALREAGIHSDWNNPDTAYEESVNSFIEGILHHPEFRELMKPLFDKLKVFGIINSLSQVVLKCLCPGIPDFFQGTELWDLSLVDPDNRRPVDFAHRAEMLRDMKSGYKKDPEKFFKEIYRKKDDGRIKLWITHCLMTERAMDPVSFIRSSYIPLFAEGVLKKYILAFARAYKNTWYIVIIPLHLAVKRNQKKGKSADWGNLRIQLPAGAPYEWVNIWNNKGFNFSNNILISEILEFDCPVVLKGKTGNKERGCGILLHLSSLPGKFGIGGLGEEAYKFVDFLTMSGQTYWQILPFNPVDQTRSPYSSPSAFAGNPAFIDPDLLYNQHMLAEIPSEIKDSDRVDYPKALKIREKIIQDIYSHFMQKPSALLKKKFDSFCIKNAYWLDDFAMFSVLKEKYKNQSWSAWPPEFKKRIPGSLAKFLKDHTGELEILKFGQFIFNEQFLQLKQYAETVGVRIIGDIPIYIGFESADVWSHPELFNLDKSRRIKTIAGVPPDFFSKTGQLWNMPVYNWDAMKKDGYLWWKNRIRRNLEFCDMIRLDHFRGYSAYWEVPAGHRNAVKGKWTSGPGNDFFNEIKHEFPEMPLVAEDLGDIDDEVYKIRDNFKLPGMKVLQFAFDENMPYSVHVPHMHNFNCIAYTGTHDNNTLKGWYKDNTGNGLKKRIEQYLGRKISGNNVAWEMIRMAHASVARIAIIPMQDILNLDGSARLNVPGTLKGNWTWKMKPGYDKPALSRKLADLSATYGRI